MALVLIIDNYYFDHKKDHVLFLSNHPQNEYYC